MVLALEGGGGGIGGNGGADKIFVFFFDRVLLSQKTHRLLPASVRVRVSSSQNNDEYKINAKSYIEGAPLLRFSMQAIAVVSRV